MFIPFFSIFTFLSLLCISIERLIPSSVKLMQCYASSVCDLFCNTLRFWDHIALTTGCLVSVWFRKCRGKVSWYNRATSTKSIVLARTMWRAGVPAEIRTVTTQTETWIVKLQQLVWYKAYQSFRLRYFCIRHSDA